MLDVILDALLDTLKLFPFLLLSYVIIELLEHKTDLSKPHGGLSGNLAPLIGGATGLIPQCGFSVLAARLYERRHVTIGTLLSVFIATSDEAFVILLSSGEGAKAILPMIAVKIFVGAGVGYLADLIVRKKAEAVSPEERYSFDSCGEGHKEERAVFVYFLSPLLHSLKIAAYILLVNLAFGFLFYSAGEDAVMDFLRAGLWIQPLLAAAIGLIPNCASSVILTQTYLVGGIAFGSCLAGLCANAGLGVFVLFRNGKKWKRNLAILFVLYAVGIGVGYAVNGITLAIG